MPATGHTYDDDTDTECNTCGFVRNLSCVHTTLESIEAVAATCTVSGLSEGKKCAECGEIVELQNKTTAVGHTSVIDAAVASTCTEDGLTEGAHCEVCGEVLTEQTVINAKHTYDQYSIVTLPTADATGTAQLTCSVCGEMETVILPAISVENGYAIIDEIDGAYEWIYIYKGVSIKGKNYHVVTFNFNSDADVQTQRVLLGAAVAEPEAPAYSYTDEQGNIYQFVLADWYNDSTIWDFSTEVTQDITLKARWTFEDSFFAAKEDADDLTEGADIRVMSFNILADDWNDKPAVGPRVDHVINTIHRYMPDVVGLQECDDQWYAALLARDDFKYKLVNVTESGTIVKVSGSYTNYVTIAYNPETVELIEFEQWKLPTGSNKSVRNVTTGVFNIIQTGERFIYMSTHFNTTDWQTNRNGTELAEYIKTWEDKYPTYPILVCGDFNANEGTTPITNFVNGSGFLETKETALTKGLICRTYHKGNGFDSSVTRARDSFSPDHVKTTESIDHIFSSTSVETLWYDTVVDDDALNASDHLPIYCDVIFPESKMSVYSFTVAETDPFSVDNGGTFVDNDGDTNGVTQLQNNTYGVFYELTKGATFTTSVYVSEATEAYFVIRVSSTNGYDYNYTDAVSSLTVNGTNVPINEFVLRTTGWYVDTAKGIVVAKLSLAAGENAISFTMGTETEKTLNIAGIEFISAAPVSLNTDQG